jgi:hypothetical protein
MSATLRATRAKGQVTAGEPPVTGGLVCSLLLVLELVYEELSTGGSLCNSTTV